MVVTTDHFVTQSFHTLLLFGLYSNGKNITFPWLSKLKFSTFPENVQFQCQDCGGHRQWYHFEGHLGFSLLSNDKCISYLRILQTFH